MKFIKTPNLPQKCAKLAVVDGRIGQDTEMALRGFGIKLIKTRQCKWVYDAISYHPDIMLHHIGREIIIYAPGTDGELVEELASHGFKLFKGESALSTKYPGDIAYNVARVGSLAFHNTKHTDSKLKSALEEVGVELVHVNQGYTKCSVSVVDQCSIITSDAGVAKAAESRGVDVLVIEADENIVLPGLKNGFIGGSTGLLSKDKWTVTGDACKLKSFQKVHDFLARKNIEIISLSKKDIIDLGTIIPLKEE